MCEDEPVRPRVSESSEGSVLEGHENDPKVVLRQWLLELTTRLYPGPVQKGLGYTPRASGARAQLAVILDRWQSGMCLVFSNECHGFDAQPCPPQEGSPGRKCPGGELLKCYSYEYCEDHSSRLEGTAACEDEPV